MSAVEIETAHDVLFDLASFADVGIEALVDYLRVCLHLFLPFLGLAETELPRRKSLDTAPPTCPQTGSSGLAPARELCPFRARAAATCAPFADSLPRFMDKSPS